MAALLVFRRSRFEDAVGKRVFESVWMDGEVLGMLGGWTKLYSLNYSYILDYNGEWLDIDNGK